MKSTLSTFPFLARIIPSNRLISDSRQSRRQQILISGSGRLVRRNRKGNSFFRTHSIIRQTPSREEHSSRPSITTRSGAAGTAFMMDLLRRNIDSRSSREIFESRSLRTGNGSCSLFSLKFSSISSFANEVLCAI